MSFKGLLRPLLLSLSLFVVSCSIKENRAECPCVLTLELIGLPVRPVVLGVAGEGYSFTEVVHADTVIVLPVPKGELAVSAVGGALAEGDGTIRIPAGEEAPPLYLFHASVSTASEQVVLPVLLHKQFCSLELVFNAPPNYGPPYEVTIEGGFCGWLPDGSPLAGPFSRRMVPDGSPAPAPFSRHLLPGSYGRAVLRLPRPGDDSLLMHIVFSDRIVRTFALGSYIAASGYDWSAPDLEDLTLNVDISVTSVTISTDLWSRTEEIELFI